MASRKCSVKFGGAVADQYKDSQMTINYLNIFADSDIDNNIFPNWSGGKITDYSTIFASYITVAPESNPIILNYSDSIDYNTTPEVGLTVIGEDHSKNYSIYRREYEVYNKPWPKQKGYLYNNKFYYDIQHLQLIPPRTKVLYIDLSNSSRQLAYEYSVKHSKYILSEHVRIYKGEWEPVIVQNNISLLYDFNVTNGRSYQYILYPAETYAIDDNEQAETVYQIFANASAEYHIWQQDSVYPGSQGMIISGSVETSNQNGAPVITCWDEWSICELEPIEYDRDIAIIKNAYTVNTDQVWMFKYALETGGQSQNITRNDIQTLGQFPKIGFGQTNYVSGEVSALLGSEIIPYSKQGYIERLQRSRLTPLSTNEKTKMLEQWRKFVGSKNPKLLKDIKGQSWIVQITGASNTPKNLYYQQPDTISFQWKQVEDTKNVIIYSKINSASQSSELQCETEWAPLFKNKQYIEE